MRWVSSSDARYRERWADRPKPAAARPTGPHTTKRDWLTGTLVARYQRRAPFEFWAMRGRWRKPAERVPASFAERAGYSMDDEWALQRRQFLEAAQKEGPTHDRRH